MACYFDRNNGNYGSSISVLGGQITINKTNFTNNKAYKYAAGIYSENDSIVKITNCEFIENSSDKDAGAIFTTKSNVIIENSYFKSNLNIN